MRLSRTSEAALIEMFRRQTHVKGSSVLLGIGDDAAILRPPKARQLLFTTDMLIEGRHFHLKDAAPFEIGRKAMAVNLSDIAAMGGRPTHAVAAVGLPSKLTVSFVKELYRGMEETARNFGAALVGGDTNQSDLLVLSIALLGEAIGPRGAVRRSGAKPGNAIFVTGRLGGSYASKKHLNFIPRLKEAEHLVKKYKPTAMMDLSDGLSADLAKLAAASRVGAVLAEDALPSAVKKNSTKAALSDGEDFELLFTLSAKDAARLTAEKHPKGLAPFSRIGTIVDRRLGLRLKTTGGYFKKLSSTGFDHFK